MLCFEASPKGCTGGVGDQGGQEAGRRQVLQVGTRPLVTFQISLERAFSRKKKISIIFSGYKVIEVLSWSLDLALLKIKIV